jgi:uncharacterized protein YjiS (DUF1127 family)
MSIRGSAARRDGETRLNAVLANRRRLQMSLSTLFDDVVVETNNVPNPVATAFAVAARAVTEWRLQRARRLALNDLLGMEPHRLRDLGISVDDVRQALQR